MDARRVAARCFHNGIRQPVASEPSAVPKSFATRQELFCGTPICPASGASPHGCPMFQSAHAPRAILKPDLLQNTTDVSGTFNFSAQFLEASLPLCPSMNRHIIVSELKVSLSFGLFCCGVQVRCSAAVNHPLIDIESARLDVAKPWACPESRNDRASKEVNPCPGKEGEWARTRLPSGKRRRKQFQATEPR